MLATSKYCLGQVESKVQCFIAIGLVTESI